MNTQRYYISVQARTIMEQQGDAAYELEIEATPEEIAQLNEYFNSLNEFDESSYFQMQLPGIPYHYDMENDGYDYYLKEVYRLIYNTGTNQTKSFVQSMNILSL